jgi:hypothetical protein
VARGDAAAHPKAGAPAMGMSAAATAGCSTWARARISSALVQPCMRVCVLKPELLEQPCMQVGALKPDADEQLKATLIIEHPHESVTFEQGSFLHPKDVHALASMQAHLDVQPLRDEINLRLASVRRPGNAIACHSAALCVRMHAHAAPHHTAMHACRSQAASGTCA